MGSIKKRPDGKWRARYRGPDRKEHARHFAKKSDAERWLATQTADIARGAWISPAAGRITFAEWVPRWEAGLHDLRPTTRELNVGIVRNHLLPRFGTWQLAQIGTADVKAMVAEDIGTVSNSAVRRRVLVLRQVLAAAVADGRLARNPCDGVKLPPEDSRRMRFLDPGQVVALADAIRPVHYRPLVLTAAYLGLRWGELAGLAVESVDTLRRTVRVERQLVEVAGGVRFGPPKTRSGVRTVTMPATLAELLAEHMAAVRSSGLVFPNTQGRPMRRSPFRQIWRRAVDEVFAGTDLDGLVFHELRHTAAALAIAQGAHPLVIRDRLGHASITTTLDVYGGLFPATDEALAEGLDGVLRESLARADADGLRTSADSVARLRRSAG